MEQDRFLADGIITEEMRRMLKEKRSMLGLPYERLGNLFGVNWSTVRKWENGLTTTCNTIHRQGLLDLLRGEYDQRLRQTIPGVDYTAVARLPRSIQFCMDRLTNTYLICKGNEALQQNLVKDIDRVTSDILQEVVEASAPPAAAKPAPHPRSTPLRGATRN